MHHLQRSTQNCAAEIAVGVEDVAAEAVEPAIEVATLGNSLQLVLEVGVDLSQLGLDVLRVSRLATNTSENLAGLLLLALADEVTRRLGQEEQTEAQNESPEHLEPNGDAVGRRIGAMLGSIVDTGCQHQTNSNAELVAGDDGTAHFAGGNLRHVQNDDGGDESNTKSGNQTTSHEEAQAAGSSLQNNTDDKDNASRNDGNAATKPVCQVTSNQSTKESTGREDRDDQGLLPGGNNELVFGRSGFVLLSMSVCEQ